ncbi:MAG: amidohydrolase [Candidatus Bipolaricaulota bacterium]|nr:amidohydrolase [Candidatus Bipolaricaulota bacterium]
MISLDVAIYNASVYTMNPRCPQTQAVGIKGNRVLVVGKNEEIRRLCSNSTERIDAHGKVLLPGFIDAHTHFRLMGVRMNNYLDLTSVSSKQDLLQRLKSFATKKESPGWVIGTGWDESKWSGDCTFMLAEEIDTAVSHPPVALERVDCHLYCVNSQGLEVLNLDPSIRGFETELGEPTGRLFEDAAALLRQVIKPDQEQSISGIQRATDYAYHHGVTSIHQMVVEEGEFREDLKSCQRLRRDNQPGMRMRLYFTPNYLNKMITLGLASGFGDSNLQVGGLKLFSDGSIGAKTAWVTEGYQDNPENKGMRIWNSEELEALIRKAHENDIQLAIHAIGTQALSQVLGCLEAVLQDDPKPHLRHRIEHCEMLTEEQVQRMKDLGVIASMQPNFTGEWGLPGGMYEGRFGRERIETMNPLRWVVDSGVPLALGSDCMPFGPLYGIHWAVNAPFPAQRLSVEEAVRGYTMGAAFAGNAEQEVGSIEPGKLADLIMLNGDPFSEPAGIKDMKVEMTLFDGRVVYREDDE